MTKTIDNKPMNDVMLDLETLGTGPGCSILSIGAVAFDRHSKELGEGFYVVVNRNSCLLAGLREDDSTLDWWAKQSEAAREVIAHAEEGGYPLAHALEQFTQYLSQFNCKELKVWGNGSDFDNAILAHCYRAVGQALPWEFWNNRCYRTLKDLIAGPKLVREGTYHNALDDARSQARHTLQLMHGWR